MAVRRLRASCLRFPALFGQLAVSRKAARSAAKEAGEAAMATAFELTTLYESTKAKKPTEAPVERAPPAATASKKTT